MPISSSDILMRFSGGASNTDPNACLGGAISTAATTTGQVDSGVANDLFDDVSSAEALAGDTEYRGVYIKNNHGSLTLSDARVYISANSANTSDIIDLALADEAVNTTIETIANEGTAPVGPTFSHPANFSGGLQLNSTTGLTAGSYKGIWVKRTITAGAASGTINDNTITVEGTTA